MRNEIRVIVVLCAVAWIRGENVLESPACENQRSESFVKSPTSCRHYLYCFRGKVGYEGKCTMGLAFDPKQQICTDVRQVEGCSVAELGIKPLFQSEDGIENQYDDQTLEEGQQHEYDPIGVPVEGDEDEHHDEEPEKSEEEEAFVPDPYSPCAGARDNSYVRHPLSCQSYFHCMHGRADLEDKCPEGFAFNFDDQICDFADLVICASCPLTGTIDIADPDACNFFYRCVNGVRTHFSCINGDRFDSAVGACRPRAQVRCSTANICTQPNQTSSIVVADYNDCKKYGPHSFSHRMRNETRLHLSL